MLCLTENLLKGSVATEQDSRLNLTWGVDHSRSSVKFAGEEEGEEEHDANSEDDESVSCQIPESSRNPGCQLFRILARLLQCVQLATLVTQ